MNYELVVLDNQPKSLETPKSFYRRQSVGFFIEFTRSCPAGDLALNRDRKLALINSVFHINQRQGLFNLTGNKYYKYTGKYLMVLLLVLLNRIPVHSQQGQPKTAMA